MSIKEQSHEESWGFIIIFVALSIIGLVVVLQPAQQERVKLWEHEKTWINSATCQELKNYIIIGIEQNPEDSHFFISNAKDLYEWKCIK